MRKLLPFGHCWWSPPGNSSFTLRLWQTYFIRYRKAGLTLWSKANVTHVSAPLSITLGWYQPAGGNTQGTSGTSMQMLVVAPKQKPAEHADSSLLSSPEPLVLLLWQI